MSPSKSAVFDDLDLGPFLQLQPFITACPPPQIITRMHCAQTTSRASLVYAMQLCPSVCPSIQLTHPLSKWLNVSSRFI